MKQNTYGKEAFNLRLTVLRMVEKLPILLALTVLGTLFVGGGYYVKNVLLRQDPGYVAQSVYHIEYAVESEAEIGAVYINQTSWNTYVHSEVFLNAVRDCLETESVENSTISAMLEATLASDLRVPSIEVRAKDKEVCQTVHLAVDRVMTEYVPLSLREIEAVTVLDSTAEAYPVIPDVRVGRAFALGAVLSGFFVIVVFLLRETWVDALWLPAAMWKRYGLPMVGTLESKPLAENVKYFFGDKKKVAVCPVTEHTDSAQVLQALREVCGEEDMQDWYSVPSPRLSPEVCRELRDADGILLVVESGIRGNVSLEPVLEYLWQQDCKPTAGIMVNANEKLLKAYYCLGKDEG